MMSDEDWVKAAMMDDSVVVELLVSLNHMTSKPPSPTIREFPAAPPLGWSVRQRRSKPMILPAAKKPPATRASPTTPLSWSGATSISGGGVRTVDGFEESSPPSDISRSKVIRTSETTPTKRPRKKKTLAELKEDEILLLKERRHLKRELATLRITLEKQRTENESLKKMKLNLQPQPESQVLEAVALDETISDQTRQNVAVSDSVPPILPQSVRPDIPNELPKPEISNNSLTVQKAVIEQEDKFVLPDLNLPIGGDFSSEVLCGIS